MKQLRNILKESLTTDIKAYLSSLNIKNIETKTKNGETSIIFCANEEENSHFYPPKTKRGFLKYSFDMDSSGGSYDSPSNYGNRCAEKLKKQLLTKFFNNNYETYKKIKDLNVTYITKDARDHLSYLSTIYKEKYSLDFSKYPQNSIIYLILFNDVVAGNYKQLDINDVVPYIDAIITHCYNDFGFVDDNMTKNVSFKFSRDSYGYGSSESKEGFVNPVRVTFLYNFDNIPADMPALKEYYWKTNYLEGSPDYEFKNNTRDLYLNHEFNYTVRNKLKEILEGNFITLKDITIKVENIYVYVNDYDALEPNFATKIHNGPRAKLLDFSFKFGVECSIYPTDKETVLTY